jgi:D-alanine--D-alanine ligase
MSRSRSRYGKVGVLAGGPSSEREISLKSGNAVYSALVREGVDTVLLDVTDDVCEKVTSNKVDVAFIALHGQFGEDGIVQNMLEEIRVPYTGSGAQASRLALDKIASKAAFIKFGIRSPKYVAFEKDSYNIEDACNLGLPVVVKPYLEGSSIGLSVVRNKDDLYSAVAKAFEYGSKVLVEEYINGRELTVGILGDKPLPVIEIVTKENMYDYQAKYLDPETKYLVPAPIDDKVTKLAQELCLRTHKSLGCRCFSRVDIMMDASGELFVLEANTIPGMTQRSLLPKAAEAAGLSFGALCVTLVEDALARWDNYGKTK